MLQNHKFVFCCNIPKAFSTGSVGDLYSNLIKDIANSISGAFVVDVDAYSSEIEPLCQSRRMSSVGYAALASFIGKAIDDTIANNTYFVNGDIDV